MEINVYDHDGNRLHWDQWDDLARNKLGKRPSNRLEIVSLGSYREAWILYGSLDPIWKLGSYIEAWILYKSLDPIWKL